MIKKVRSLDFLPSIFQTPTNAQFLGATVDQLISQPNLAPLQGYIGEHFGPGINPHDTYIPEPTKTRTDYQLEPGVIFLKPDTNKVYDFLTYPGILDAIGIEGGVTNNPQELFNNQFYSWDPFVDMDKIVNFSQYYWLPNGPVPVTLTTNTLYGDQNYVVKSTPQGYLFDEDADLNPTITLLRGARYEFEVNQQSQFWIQGEPGLSGTDPAAPNINTREILGVVNNGDTKGTVIFDVPTKDAQDAYANLPGDYPVDLATDLNYLDFTNDGYTLQTISNISQATPGVVTTPRDHGLYNGAQVIFESVEGMTQINNMSFYAKVLTPTTFSLYYDYALTATVQVVAPGVRPTTGPVNTSLYSAYTSGGTVSTPSWKTLDQIPNIDGVTSYAGKTVLIWKGNYNEGVYRVVLINEPPDGWSVNAYDAERYGFSQQPRVNLVPVTDPPQNLFKIVIQGGNVYAQRAFYKTANGTINLIPYISANKDILYYQDSVFPNNVGVIKLVDDNLNYKINVVTDILGKKQARVPQSDPTGVTLTNGLKVRFQGNVVPAAYLQGEYYVEGVGDSIQLIPTTILDVENEPFLIDDKLAQADYITINRASKDRNAWTRSNRWFHSNVIQTVEQVNKTFDVAPGYIIKDQRAKRPIIEFRAGLKLFNQGVIGTDPVSYADTVTTDALSTVAGQPFGGFTLAVSAVTKASAAVVTVQNPTDLVNGSRVTFANVVGMTQLNGNSYYAKTTGYAANQFALYTDTNLTAPLNTSSFGAYTSGGTITSTGIQLNQLAVGDTIIFTADTNGAAATQFYVGNLNGNILLESGYTYQVNDQSYITNGVYAADTFWYDGLAPNLWNLGQRKQVVNQEPFFNVFNNSGISFSDTAYYPNTTFAGNKLFSFARGTGTADSILGIPLKYAGVGNLGDITFDVNFYSENFSYTSNGTTVTEAVSDGYVYDYTSLTDYTRLLGWQTAIENSVQYQVFTFTAAATDYNYNFTSTRFVCDIPAVSDTATSWINCVLYVDSKLQDINSYTVSINPTALVTGTNTGAVVQTNRGGIGYTPNATLTLTFNTPDGGTAATGTATTDALGTITSVTITDGGYGYTFDSSGVNTFNTIPLITSVSGAKPTEAAAFNFTLAAPLSPTTLVTANSQIVEGAIVNILLYSNSVSKNAYFEVPSNLANNPLNSDVTSISSGDIRLQYQSIYKNLPAATGPVFGNNNLHDLGNYIPYGTSIIQNSASLALPGAFLRNGNHNLFAALKYNSTEYQKYKDLIVDNANRGNYTNLMTPSAILDDIIATIADTKNKQSSFFWSDMLPAGAPYLSNTYNFNTTTTRTQFQLSRTYNFNAANYYGVQVYHIRTENGYTNTQTLIRDRDYTVSTTAASVTVTYPILPGDQIQVDEYYQTYGNYCPATPSKLGMYPKYVPEIVYDETYQPATWFIKGHDNSYNKLYGDYNPVTQTLDDPRDTALFEFEQRVYNNIKLPVSYNQVDSLPVPLTSVIPGKFRDTGYTRQQVVDINTSQFLNWVGQNRVNYQTQKYLPSDEYSYNYNQSTDKLDSELIPPGYWRGIYNYFYDTDHPHTAPWEMLGFTARPSWWLDRYGDAPYTSDNTLLWNDLAQGIDWNNGNPIVLPARVRPGLLNILPVNSNGELISPLNSVVGQYDYFTFKREWVYGDQAPTETAYYRSSQWPFDATRLLALTKPAQFFNYNADVDNYNYNSEFNQYLLNDRYRLQPQDVPVYGNGTSTNSYINWIVDYEQQLGISAYTEITDILNNLDVRLVYRLAGFSSKDNLAFYVEKSTPASSNNSLLIPDDSYQILLYNNQPFDRIFYSSVIVQKVDGGFSVYGNGQVETYFKTVTPIFNGQVATFTQSGLTATVSTQYNANKIIEIPYGYTFTTVQALAEFLTNYGRYLETQGVQFQKTEGTATINWEYMIYELLYWVASGWSIGSTVNLNPAAKFFQVSKDSAIVQPLTIQQQNFVLNQNLLPIQNKDMIIQRDGVDFALTPLNEGDTIAYTNLNVSNMEHAIVFDNQTVFNDVIYSLNTGLRQQRMLLRGFKTAEWTGSVNADGFILNRNNIEQWSPNKKYTKGVIVKYKNKYWVSNSIVPASTEFNKDKWFVSDYTQVQEGLLPNPSTRSAEAVLYYDINNANLEKDNSLLSYSLIGFRPREYLVAGNLPDSSQVNVYRNLIETKGTSVALNVFKLAQFPQSTIDYTTYENWAILGGQFGGVLNQNFVELELNETKLSGNPAIVALAANGTTTLAGVQQVVQLREVVNYGRQPTSANFLPTIASNSYNADTALPSAGYANFDDVKYSAYNVASLAANAEGVTALNKGNFIWIADDNGTWAMYTTQPTAAVPILVVNNLDGTVTVYFNGAHALAQNNTIAITDYDTQVNGYYTVLKVLSDSTIQVTLNLDPSVQQIQSQGVVLKLTSQRVATPADIVNLNLLNTEFLRNRVWVDSDTDTDWAVYEKTINYTATTTLSTLPTAATTSAAYTTSLGYLISQGSTGTITRYVQAAGGIIFAETVTGPAGFATQIAAGTDILVTSNAGVNSASVYELVNNTLNKLAVLNIPSGSPVEFGKYVAISADDNVIAVADGLNIVYIYARNTGGTYDYVANSAITVASGATDLFGYNMSFDYNGSRLVIAAPQRTVDGKLESGTVYVFDKLGTDTTYTLVQTITQPTGAGYEAADAGAEFGRGLAADGTVSELLTGAPYALNQIDGQFVEGAVYRFTDIGKKTGAVQGVISSFVNGTVYINGVAVQIFASDAATTAAAINNSPTPIPNVQASSIGNILIISLINANNAQVNNKLTVTAAEATLQQLGMAPYQLTQTIYNPHLENIAQFGYEIAYNEQSSFIVSAPAGNQFAQTQFDYTDDAQENDTIFDHDATAFIDQNINGGAVYMFDYLGVANPSLLNPGKYAYAQSVNPVFTGTAGQGTKNSAAQGSALLFKNFSTVTGLESGALLSLNSKQTADWHQYRKSQAVVNTQSVVNVQLYDKITNSTLGYIDTIDPLAGKILGIIAQNIDYIQFTDPAVYDVTTNSNVSSLVWGEDHVGEMWIDTSVARWVNYHQNDTGYNAKYFATVFPGSVVLAYTWIESTVTPDQWPGPGIPYSTINYSLRFVEDSTGGLSPRYYFWVSDSNTVYTQLGKTINAKTAAQYIQDPLNSGVAYMAALNASTVALYNAGNNINDQTSILHIGTTVSEINDDLHQQFDLIRTDSTFDFLPGLPSAINDYAPPASLYSKFLDSFCGRDALGQIVPDQTLPLLVKTGTARRPRQSMFRDPFLALQNYISLANEVMLAISVSEEKSASFLNTTGTAATSRTGRAFDTADYWQYVNWWATGYSNSTKIVQEVARYYLLQTIQAYEGLVVKVTDNGQGVFEVYIYQSGEWVRIGLQNGTIQILPSLYATTTLELMPSDAIYWIIRALNEQIYTNNELIYRNKSLILMFKYIVSEADDGQNYLPWLMKTSFLDVDHKLRDLIEYENFQRDNEAFLQGYIRETKPYHVVIKDFSLVYSRTDTYFGDITDFDVPAKYNSSLGQFYSPQLQYNANDPAAFNLYPPSDPIWQTTDYKNWFANYGLGLLPDGIPDFPITTTTEFVTLPINTNVTQNYATATAAIRVADPTKLFVGQYITSASGAIPLNTLITSINVSTGVISLNKATIAILLTTDTLTAYDAISVDNAYSLLSSGVIRIGLEKIAYQTVDRYAGTISGLTRGYNNTVPAEHIAGVTVYQDLPSIQVYDGARGYSLTLPPKITASIDTNIYPTPRQTVSLTPNLNSEGTITSVDIVTPGAGYAIQPVIEVEPSPNPGLTQYFALDDITYNNSVGAATNRNTITIIVPKSNAVNVPTVASAVASSTKASVLYAEGITVGMGVLYDGDMSSTAVPTNTTVIKVEPSDGVTPAVLTFNNAVTLPQDATLTFVHQFRTGDPVRFKALAGAKPPLGLLDNYYYYVGATGGVVTSVVLTSSGSNYIDIPNVKIQGGGGYGAAAAAYMKITDDAQALTILSGGVGYQLDDLVELRVVNQTPAVFKVVLVNSGSIADNGLSYVSGGEYSSLPSSVASLVTSKGGVYSITLTSPGSMYTVKPTVQIVLGGGTGATASVDTMTLTSVDINAGGTGYTLNDTLTLVGGAGSSAARLTVSEIDNGGAGPGVITRVTIANAGSYTALPNTTADTVTGGTGSSATFDLGFSVLAISLTTPGSGYTSAPSVQFVTGSGDTTGSGASATTLLPFGATVTVNNYSIAAIDIVSNPFDITIPTGGVDYTTVPSVTISGGGGTGAAAIAVIDDGRPQSRIALFKNRADAFNNINRVQLLNDGRTSSVKDYRLAVTAIIGSLFGGTAVREMTTNILFDRTSYTTTVSTWNPNTWYAGVFEDVQRLASTNINSSTGLETSLHSSVLAGTTVLILENKSWYVQSASYNAVAETVTARFVTGVTTNLAAAASLNTVITVDSVTNIYAGMLVNIGQDSTPAQDNAVITVLSVNYGSSQVTLDTAITEPAGQTIGFSNYNIQNVGVDDYVNYAMNHRVISVDNLEHNATTIVYQASSAPSAGTLVSFIPNIEKLVDDDINRVDELLVTGYGIASDTKITASGVSYLANTGFVTILIDNSAILDISTASTVKISTISSVLGSTAIASYEGISLEILTITPSLDPKVSTQVTFNWKNPSDLNAPLRIAPAQVNGQQVAFYSAGQYTQTPVYYYVQIVNQLNSLPVNNTQVKLFLNKELTQPVTAFNFTTGDIGLIPTPVIFDRSVVSYQGKLYRCVLSNNDAQFNVEHWEVISNANYRLNALDRIAAFYAPTVNMPNNVNSLMSGLEYPNSTFYGVQLLGDSAFGGPAPADQFALRPIVGITRANPAVVTTQTEHGLKDADGITIIDITGMPEVNGVSYYAKVSGYTAYTFALFTDIELTLPVNSISYTAYVQGGQVIRFLPARDYIWGYVALPGETNVSEPANEAWDAGGWSYTEPRATSFDTIDTFLQAPALVNTTPTTYDVVGGAFADGYSPEEMVAGNVTDDVTISVKTRPGASWDPLTVFTGPDGTASSAGRVDHTGYKVITLVFNTSEDGTTYSFDGVTANPLSLDVFIGVQSTVKGVLQQELVRAYYNGDVLNPVDQSYPYTFTTNWQNKTVTVYNNGTTLFPANTEVQVSVNEIGGGNQLIRTSTEYTPFTPDTVPANSQLELDITYFDSLSPASSFAPAAAPADPYIPPVIYNNGNRILYRGLVSTTAYAPFSGVVDQIIVNNGGSGYTVEPKVSIFPVGGTGSYASARAVVRGGAVTAVIVTNSGSDYNQTPIIQIEAPTAVDGVIATATAYIAIPAVQITQGGRLYNPVAGETTVTFSVPRVSYPSGAVIPGGRAATGIVNVSVLDPTGAGGVITGISITDPGYGYQVGTIEGFIVLNGGVGYASAPQVNLVDPTGALIATATASITGIVDTITINDGGTGYITAPTVIFTGGAGAGATGTAVLGTGPTAGKVVSITVTDAGTGYTHPPQVVFNNTGTGGSGAIATATITGSVSSVAVPVLLTGSALTAAPIVLFDNTGTGGSGAAAVASTSGLPSTYNGGIVIGQPLSPVPASEQAHAIATRVSSYNYTSLIVESITVTDGGSGYTTAPTVSLTGGGGSYGAGILYGGATAVATLGDGFTGPVDSVVSITVTSTGSGFSFTPSISFSAPDLVTGTVPTATVNTRDITPLTYRFGSNNNQVTVNFNRTIDIVNEYITLVVFGPSVAQSGAIELNSYAAPETQLFNVRSGQTSFPLKNYALQSNPDNAIVELNGRRISEVFYRVAVEVADGQTYGYPAPVPVPEIADLNDIWYQKLDGYIGVGDYGTIVASRGGPTWNWEAQSAIGASRPFNSVVANYDDTSAAYKFTVAVGDGGQVYYNPNPFQVTPVAYDWEPSIDFPFASDLINVSYDKVNEQFMALGAVETVYTTGGGVLAVSGYGFAQVVAAGALLKININSAGTGYVTAPTVVITAVGAGSGATAVATIGGGSIISVTITNPGVGYTTTPLISFTGGGGSGAAASAVVSAGTSVSWNSALAPALGWDDASTGWDSPVEWDLGTPVFASASHRTATGAGIESMTVIACAGGAVLLSQNPYDLNDSVYTITLGSGGSGYSATPTVTIVGGGGTGATATATVVSGIITGIALDTGGSGYISNPTVVITDSTGIGASALASIDARSWVYMGSTTTGTTTDFTSIAYDEVNDYFMIAGLDGELTSLVLGSTSVTKAITVVDSGYSFTVASAAGLTVGSRLTGGPIPTEVYCYVTGINGNVINVTRNPTSSDGTWTFTVGDSMTFGNTLTFASETSGTTRDFTKIIWTDIYGPNNDPTTYPARWAAIGPGGVLVTRDSSVLVSPTWTLAGLPDISSSALTWDSDDNIFAITGNFGLVWTWDETTLNTVRQFDPTSLQVLVNGTPQTYGVEWVINLNPVYYKTLFDGEYAGTKGFFNSTPFAASSVWIIFNQVSKPVSGATVKIVYESSIPTYRIVGQTITVYQQLQTGDSLAVTTFNYTDQQSLSTDFYTGQQSSGIIGINRFVTPALVLTGTGTIIAGTSLSDPGFNFAGPASSTVTGTVVSTVGGIGAKVSATLNATGNVKDIVISPAGAGYTSPPLVIFADPPSGGVVATGVATISTGAVTGITITNPGSGYVTAPGITFDNTGTGGAGAAATCSLGYSIDPTSLVISDGGQGYTPTTTTVTWSGSPEREATIAWNISGDQLNFVNGAHIRIEGVRGTTELNSSTPGNNGYYIDIQGPYTAALYYDAALTNPVTGPGLQPYESSGYMFNYQAFLISQSLWGNFDNTDRLWVTVNGARVLPENLRIYNYPVAFGSSIIQKELAILESFDDNTEVLATSMTPYSTPGQMNFSIQLKTDIDSVYDLTLTSIELITPSSLDWGSDPSAVTVEIENPDLFGGPTPVLPTLQVVLGAVGSAEEGQIIAINVIQPLASGYTSAPKIRITGPGTRAPVCRAIMQQSPTVLGIVRRNNYASTTWLTQPLTDIDAVIYVQHAERLVEIYEIDSTASTYTYTNKFTGTTQTVYGVRLPESDYNMFNGASLVDVTTGETLTVADYTLTAVGTNWYISFPDDSRNGDRIQGTIRIGNVLRISGEDIKFESIDLTTNTVTNLTRGYNGTIPGVYYPLHMIVQSQLPRDIMPVEYYTEAWNEDYWGPLQASETPPAIFLKRDVI